MSQIYYLNGDILPNIPVPHDCIIDSITFENQNIIFTFEQDISYHDSIKCIMPGVKSLVIKFHLFDDSFSLYKWHKPIKIIASDGYYKSVDCTKLFSLTSSKCRLEYINHHVAYQSIIIDLFCQDPIRIELSADYIVFCWK